MTIRAVVFDIGGVLELTPSTGWWAKWEGILGLAAGELRKRPFSIWRAGSTGALSEAEVQQQLGELLAISDEQVQAMMADMWEEYLGTLNVELTNYFQNLRPAYRTAILSNSFVGAREREQARYGFADMCERIIYSHEVGLQKPDPQIYQLTCDQLDLPPSAILFVDDSEVNVAAARAFGITAVHYRNNQQTMAEMEQCL